MKFVFYEFKNFNQFGLPRNTFFTFFVNPLEFGGEHKWGGRGGRAIFKLSPPWGKLAGTFCGQIEKKNPPPPQKLWIFLIGNFSSCGKLFFSFLLLEKKKKKNPPTWLNLFVGGSKTANWKGLNKNPKKGDFSGAQKGGVFFFFLVFFLLGGFLLPTRIFEKQPLKKTPPYRVGVLFPNPK